MFHLPFKMKNMALSVLLFGAMQNAIALCDEYMPNISAYQTNDTYYDVYCPSDGIILLKNHSDGVKSPRAYYLEQKTGKKLFHYDDGDMFRNGLAVVSKNGKWGVINTKNEVVIPFEYEQLTATYQKPYWMIAQKNGKKGMIDHTGVIKIPLQYDDIGQFTDGLNLVTKGDKQAFIDMQNRVVIDWAEREYETEFIYGLTYYYENGKNHVINRKGDNVYSTTYEVSSIDKKHIRVVRNSEYYGLVSHQGKMILPTQYQYIHYLSDGLIAVVKNNRLGFLDEHGKVVIPMNYDYQEEDEIYTYKLLAVNGIVTVRQVGKRGKWALFNTQGKQITPFEYDFLDPEYISMHGKTLPAEQMWIQAYKNGKAGFIDNTGKVKIPLEYDEVFPYSEGKSAVVKDGKVGFIDVNNQVVIPLKYQFVRPSSAEGIANNYQPYFFFDGKAILLNPNIEYYDEKNKEFYDYGGLETAFEINAQGQVISGEYCPIIKQYKKTKKTQKKRVK